MTGTNQPPLADERLRGDFRMEATGKTAEVFLYGSIGGWYGVTAADFVEAIADLDVETIQLRVNSPGGVVYDGVAMMNALRRHPAKVIATVDGLAASAASFLIMAADEVVMGRGTELMIHDAWNIAWGPAGDLRKEADHLDKISQTIASVYAERAGGKPEEWRDAMLAETWYSDAEAVAAGLADRVETLRDTEVADQTEVLGDDDGDDDALASIVGFHHAGRAEAPAPFIPSRTPSTAAAGPRPTNQTSAIAALVALTGAATKPPAPPAEPHPSTGEEVAPVSDLKKKLGERLGVAAAADKTDDEIIAALDEALEEGAEPTKASVPDGAVMIDGEVLASLRADAAAGRDARTVQQAAERESLVNDAVNTGRILPRQKAGWLKKLETESDAAAALQELTPGLVPVDAVGRTGGVNDSADEDIYTRAWGAETKED